VKLPSRRKDLIRKYEVSLFHDDLYSKDEIVNIIYVLLTPVLQWLKDISDLEDDEIESEIFLMCEALYRGYNKDKSSFIPFLEFQLPWYLSKLSNKLDKLTEELPKEEYSLEQYIEKELFLSVPNIFYFNKWMFKYLNRSEKYIIYMILTSDRDELSQQKLADRMNVERKTIRNKLLRIREALEKSGGFNDWS